MLDRGAEGVAVAVRAAIDGGVPTRNWSSPMRSTLLLVLLVGLGTVVAVHAGEPAASPERVLTVGPAPAPGVTPLELVILHTSDMHGYGVPRPVILPGPDDESGSLFSLATVVERLRSRVWRRNPTAARTFVRQGRGDGILLLDAGDPVSGTYDDAVSKGGFMVELMNSPLLDYDAGTVGNHGVDYGDAPFLANLAARRFPTVLANATVDATGGPVPGTVPFVVLTEGDVRIGITGVTHPFACRIGGATLGDPAEALRRVVPGLRAQCDVVIVLAHLGLEVEDGMAAALAKLRGEGAGVDLVIDGHSHGNVTWTLADGTPVVQAGYYALRVGEVRMLLDPSSKRPYELHVTRHDLHPSVTPVSPRMRKAFRGLEARIRAMDDEPVVSDMKGFFVVKTPRDAPDLPNPAADLAARSMLEIPLGPGVGRPDCAVTYHKSVRSSVAANDAGIITADLLHQVVPFDEKVLVLRRTGAQLREIAEKGLSRKFLWAGTRLTVEERPAAEAGGDPVRKLLSFEIHDRSAGRFVPVRNDAVYTVAVVDFFNKVFVKADPADVTPGELDNKEVLRRFLLLMAERPAAFFTTQDRLYPSLVMEYRP